MAIATTGSTPASAAVVSQGLSCGLGGNQTSSLSTTAAATIEAGGTFQVTLAPSGPAGKADGAEIKNMVTTFNVPSNASIVAGSASASGGSGTLGAYSTSISGTTVKLTVPGPIANGASFVNPTLKFNLKATGAAGGTIKTTFRQSAAYTLTAAGSINISCDATTPLTTLTSTTIEAVATTTSTTTTTAPTTTTTTKPGATTTSTTAPATTTTTAPPTTSTSAWSPTGPCGTVQTVVAPANTQSVQITATGGTGGRSGSQASSATVAGGSGGQAAATFAASAGQTFSAIVGCNGVNGGSFANTATPGGYAAGGGTGRGTIIAGQSGASGGSGGGASGACLGAVCAPGSGTPLVVAGGGGGGGVSNCAGTSSGAGGSGGSGSSTASGSGAGNSGTNGSSASSSGGAGGVNSNGGSAAGGSNGNGSGGAGVNVVGGAGGGGYVGGAAGSNTSAGCKGAGGGGGGSSWIRSTGTQTSFSTASSPAVTLTFTIVTPAPTTTTTQPTTTTTTAAPCVADKAPFPTVQALVTQQFQDFTAKAPTSAQNTQWVSGITSCTTTADALIVSLLPTDQTQDDARLVRLYLAYFKRPPDPDGFAYWQRQLDAGRGLINAAKKFAESPEFKRTYGPLSNADFIELVYQNVLGRGSDPTGKAFWLTRLNNKTKNRGDVMINFSESSENIRNKVNHVQVFRLHRGMMQKFPSKTTYFDLLNPILNNGKTLEDAAKAIRLSAPYDARV
ncbi:MAG TPA: DUF4214 domain-containing protein [Acidimicrobiales bacterium]|nr:DUF4214 domain-containing protein [Acidimicrobiales bacterium]